MGTFGIWHGLVLLVPVALALAFYIHAKRGDGLNGKRGWLLLLIMSWTVVTPLTSLLSFFSDFNAAETANPGLVELDQWMRFKWSALTLHLAVAGLYFWGGWGLATGKAWSVVVRAQWILWLTTPAYLLFGYAVLPFVFFGQASPVADQLSVFVGMFIGICIWSAYLARSRRVKLNYGFAKDRDIVRAFE